jgi:hypothetical protein
MVVRHPHNRQLLEGDQIKSIDDAAAVLVGKGATPPVNTPMDSCHNTTLLGRRWRTLLVSTEMASSHRKSLLLGAEAAWV